MQPFAHGDTDMGATLTFYGAAGNVTGSRYLLEAGGRRLLIDCGLYQERDLRHRNWEPFPVDPSSIDAVVLTHAHLDHCGYLPKLVREGFEGPVYATHPTCELARIVLADSAHIQEEDAAKKRQRHERQKRKPPHPDVPLYTSEDAERVSSLLEPCEFGRTLSLGPSLEAELSEAGHILGAASIQLRLKENGTGHNLVFSGDLGRQSVPLLPDPAPFAEADTLVLESTYGDRNHEPVADIPSRLAAVVNETHEAGGNVVIPSFAIERAQDLLYYLSDLLAEDRIPHLMVFVDSPMAIRVTDVFRRYPHLFDEETAARLARGDHPCDFEGLQLTRSVAASKAINHIRGSSIVIAGSGMCTGGRVKHHLVSNISRPESCVLFVGYQAHGTLGRRILDGDTPVRILGEEHDVKARIERIEGFSGHADADELLGWVRAIQNRPDRILVTHGEPDASATLANHLREEMAVEVTAPRYEQSVRLV